MSKIPVYSSQLDAFKSEAGHIARRIVYVHREQPLLSTFKRNDALSKAFGFKGHADLVTHSRSITEPKNIEKYAFLEWRKLWDEHQIAFYFSEYLSLNEQQVFDALNKAVPKQTEFEVIDGTPILQFSPLDDDISNELRSDDELQTWFNVPFVLEDYDGETRNYTVYCLDGGAWDRATGKSYGSKSREEAVKAARDLKNKFTHYRDYGIVDDGITRIDVKGVHNELDAFNTIIRECSMRQTYAGEIKNVLENVIVSFEEKHGIDLQLLLAMLCNSTIPKALVGTENDLGAFESADFLVDSDESKLVLSIDDHYLAQFLQMSTPPELALHTDPELPMSYEALDGKVPRSRRITSTVWAEGSDNKYVVKSYVLDGKEYYSIAN
jgi:hypothetical protein